MTKAPFNEEFFRKVFSKELQEAQRAGHPSFQSLVEFACGELGAEQAAAVSSHLSNCATCEKRMEKIRTELRKAYEAMNQNFPDPLTFFGESPSSQPLSGLDRRAGGRLRELFSRKALVAHGLAFAACSVLLVLANAALRAKPAPLGQELPGWWSLWVVLPWAGVLAAHVLWSLKR